LAQKFYVDTTPDSGSYLHRVTDKFLDNDAPATRIANDGEETHCVGVVCAVVKTICISYAENRDRQD
jgi:hypothetical protein